MRISRCFRFGALLATLVLSASAQDGGNLPSAPSATLNQQRPQAPRTEQAPQRKTDSTPKPPVIESLEVKPKPLATESAQAEQTAPKQEAPKAPAAQDSSAVANPGEKPFTVKVPVNEVNVVFTVTDKHNHYVKDLKQGDFKVTDDGKVPENVRNFASETNLPLRVGLLVDASNSIRDRFRFEQQAAIEFLNQIVRQDRDQAFVLGFDTTPEITQDFTGSTEKLGNGVRMLRPGGGTAMYDAIYGACRDKLLNVDKLRNAAVAGPLRRAIILLSDGEDNQSRVTRDDSIEEAQRAEVIIYTISTNVSGTKSRGDKILEAIANATGGRAFFPFKIEDVSDAFSQIQEELRSQYAISYKPAGFMANGKYRTIDIQAVNKKYKVRSRKGYFAPRGEIASASGGQ